MLKGGFRGMSLLLKNMQNVYFIGIGGVSMSSLAFILQKAGKIVNGYDMNSSETTNLLEESGIHVDFDVNLSGISHADTVVYTAAIKDDDTMLTYARNNNKNILTRAELLGMVTGIYKNSIGISGTHGKSTTTGFVTEILLAEDNDSTILAGAGLPSLGGSLYRIGSGDVAAFEACEYKNSYHHMHPTVKVVLNCEHDHVDFFPQLGDVVDSFTTYLNIPGNGGVNVGVINADCENSVTAAKASSAELKYFSVKDKADMYARNIDLSTGYAKFDIISGDEGQIGHIQLKVPGMHNVSNALAAALAAKVCGISNESVLRGLQSFTGVKRRFEKIGVLPSGALIVDDYAHHPDEIQATVAAAHRVCKGKLICIFQPHTYTRTKALINDFAKALSPCDSVVLAKIYPAREPDIYGVSSQDLACLIPHSRCFDSFSEIASYVQSIAKDGDMVITMGAGDVYKISDYFLFA